MPFIQRPPGFSTETLDLLDKAIMGMWQEHVSTVKVETPVLQVQPAAVVAPRSGLLVYRARSKRSSCH